MKLKQPKKLGFKELKEKYQLLRDLMDYIPDVIYFKDIKGKFVMVNHAHAKGLGVKPEALVGKTDFDLFQKIIGPCRSRTYDLDIKSVLLCQLS